MKTAIIHDYLNQYGGAEFVVSVLNELFPKAPIYTSFYLPDETHPSFRSLNIRTSFMQRLPFLKNHFKKYLWLYPRAIESFDLSGYDLLLSSSSTFAKGVKKTRNQCHICYCHSPMRFAWNYEKYIAHHKFNPLEKMVLSKLVQRLKMWDIQNSRNVNYFIANSKNTKNKIEQYYQKEAHVIYPPVDFEKFRVMPDIDHYFLVLSRLNTYKNIDLAIQAFNHLQIPLKIIGTGPDAPRLKKIAKKNIHFLGRVSDKTLVETLSRAQALIVPGEEDFGIAALESMASGRPVIAYHRGGSVETVLESQTGLFFEEQTAKALEEAVRKFQASSFNSTDIRRHASQYDKNLFKKNMRDFIQKYVK